MELGRRPVAPGQGGLPGEQRLARESVREIVLALGADVEGDAGAGVATYAVALGRDASYRIVRDFLNPASVASLLLLPALASAAIPQLGLPLAMAFLAVLCGVLLASVAERRGRVTVHFTPTDPPYIIFLNLASGLA